MSLRLVLGSDDGGGGAVEGQLGNSRCLYLISLRLALGSEDGEGRGEIGNSGSQCVWSCLVVKIKGLFLFIG